MSAAAGFFGKIPSRGDFVRQGLPADFTAALDGWWQRVLADSRDRLGEAWVEAWMQAPVWHFALAAGCCGAAPVVGVWVPSTDRAGRLFPLTIARVGATWSDIARSAPFLAAAEAYGVQAVEDDVDPADLTRAIGAFAIDDGAPIDPPGPGSTRWWSLGSPLVAATTRMATGMPDGSSFAAMLRDDAAG